MRHLRSDRRRGLRLWRGICSGRCSCGKAVAENPGMSNRAIAADIGVDEKVVRNARKAGADNSAPETPTGRDGKSYPAKMPATCEGESSGFCGAAPEFIKPAAAYADVLAIERSAYLD